MPRGGASPQPSRPTTALVGRVHGADPWRTSSGQRFGERRRSRRWKRTSLAANEDQGYARDP
jgi:hypothetical protein